MAPCTSRRCDGGAPPAWVIFAWVGTDLGGAAATRGPLLDGSDHAACGGRGGYLVQACNRGLAGPRSCRGRAPPGCTCKALGTWGGTAEKAHPDLHPPIPSCNNNHGDHDAAQQPAGLHQPGHSCRAPLGPGCCLPARDRQRQCQQHGFQRARYPRAAAQRCAQEREPVHARACGCHQGRSGSGRSQAARGDHRGRPRWCLRCRDPRRGWRGGFPDRAQAGQLQGAQSCDFGVHTSHAAPGGAPSTRSSTIWGRARPAIGGMVALHAAACGCGAASALAGTSRGQPAVAVLHVMPCQSSCEAAGPPREANQAGARGRNYDPPPWCVQIPATHPAPPLAACPAALRRRHPAVHGGGV